jgi:hypothetical protein
VNSRPNKKFHGIAHTTGPLLIVLISTSLIVKTIVSFIGKGETHTIRTRSGVVKTLEKRIRVDDITRGNNVRTAHNSLAITITTTHTIARSAGRHFVLGMPRLRIK